MKSAKYSLLASAVASAIFGMQLSSSPAPADSHTPVAATASTTETHSAAANVRIDNFSFQPKELVITAGTTVTWQNADDVPHTATSKGDPQVFDSGRWIPTRSFPSPSASPANTPTTAKCTRT